METPIRSNYYCHKCRSTQTHNVDSNGVECGRCGIQSNSPMHKIRIGQMEQARGRLMEAPRLPIVAASFQTF